MKCIYSLFDNATKTYGVLTFHENYNDAVRALCQQIYNNPDLEVVLCMDYDLCYLGTFDNDNEIHPIAVDEVMHFPVKQLYADYIKQLNEVKREVHPDD